MALKDWLRGKDKGETEQLDADDLITLERFDEARRQLAAKVKASPGDLHAHQRLAEVYLRLGDVDKAIDTYVYVAESYTRDGFFDHAIALLTKVGRIAPQDDRIPIRIDRLRQRKKLERLRSVVVEALARAGTAGGTSAVEIDRLWDGLTSTPLLHHLDREQLKKLFGALRVVRVKPGSAVARRGQQMERLYLIAEGSIEAQIELPDGKRPMLRAFGPGAIVGERALLEHRPWPADYVSEGQATLLMLTVEGLERALSGNPDPRALLDALREQRNDTEIETSVRRLSG